MSNKWHTIWSKKNVVSCDYDKNEFDRFCELKKANGFDVAVRNEKAYYEYFYNGWLDFYNMLIDLGKDIPLQSVFEVGCGSGINLYMLKNRIPSIVCGGWIILNQWLKVQKYQRVLIAFNVVEQMK